MGSSRVESSTKAWTINDREIAFNLEKTPATKGRTQDPIWKLNIPKLMPMIPVACPKTTKEKLDKSIFINAKECRPSIQEIIDTVNYLEADRPPNRAFIYAYKTHGMKLEIELPHRNMDEHRIDNTIDNSVS